STNRPSTTISQSERTAPFAEVSQDIIQSITDNANDLQKTCLNTSKSIDVIQHVNISRIIECHDKVLMEHNESIIDDNQAHERIMDDNQSPEHITHDGVSNAIERMADPVSATDVTMIGSSTDQNQTISSTEISTRCATSSDYIISEDMKILCKRILLSDSIILSSTKLNKVCKSNMVDVHKACKLLIEYGLLSIETKMLANKSPYYECYMKKIPQNQSRLVDFSLKLSKFGIVNIDTYYETLKTIDTKNNTYLTPHGMSILKQKPYNDLEIVINENAIMQPAKERYHELADLTNDSHSVDKENLSVVEVDKSTNVGHEVEHCLSNAKRHRELTDKGKEYKEQQMKSKKKKNDH
ncbi:unnamed protein product, partial [Rotaria sp. Silwood1]